MKSELLKIFNKTRIGKDNPIHNFHPYPCKFPAFIPREIIKKYAKKGDVIFDPFVGSGTTLVEASLLGYSSIGNDINPLSCLLSKVKATPISKKKLEEIDIFLDNFLLEYKKNKRNITPFFYKSIDHWFQENVILELSFIKNNILDVENKDIKDLLLICFSSIIVKLSNQESDTRYAAIDKKIKDYEAINLFINKTREIKELYFSSWDNIKNKEVYVNITQLDSRDLSGIKSNSIDMIITSPPYANTYDYYLYHKHRKYWLDMGVDFAKLNEIGSRREFSSLKKKSEKWEIDLEKCFIEMKRVTRRNSLMFIIIGDSVIDKRIIKMDKVVKNISAKVGLKYLDCASVPLSSHSRMFNPKFSSSIKKEEHLILLKK